MIDELKPDDVKRNFKDWPVEDRINIIYQAIRALEYKINSIENKEVQ